MYHYLRTIENNLESFLSDDGVTNDRVKAKHFRTLFFARLRAASQFDRSWVVMTCDDMGRQTMAEASRL
jgi:hypothetical protein